MPKTLSCLILPDKKFFDAMYLTNNLSDFSNHTVALQQYNIVLDV